MTGSVCGSRQVDRLAAVAKTPVPLAQQVQLVDLLKHLAWNDLTDLATFSQAAAMQLLMELGLSG